MYLLDKLSRAHDVEHGTGETYCICTAILPGPLFFGKFSRLFGGAPLFSRLVMRDQWCSLLGWTVRKMPLRTALILLGFLGVPAMIKGQVLTLADAVSAAEANNRAIHVAQLEQGKAIDEVRAARTYRMPIFSVTALGTHSLSHLGLTFEKGSLGTYPVVGPIPGRTTTLESPQGVGGVVYANIAQPLSQQYRIGLGIQAAQVGVEASREQIRLQQQSVANEVRKLYYGILQTESGKKSLQAEVESLKQLDRDTTQDTVQKVALRADSLNVKAQLARAEYELFRLDDPLQTQKQQLNRLMGRDINTPFEADPLSAADFELPPLSEAVARAMESRPEIRLAKLKVRQAELDRRVKNAERIPDVSLSATTLATGNFTNALPTHLSVVGVQLSWDVFDWGRKRQQLNEKRQAEDQASLELKDAEALVAIDVSHQYRRLNEARKEVDVASTLQSAATESLRVMTNRYSQREALLSEVLKAQSTQATADHSFTEALLNLAAAQADFEKAVGEDQ